MTKTPNGPVKRFPKENKFMKMLVSLLLFIAVLLPASAISQERTIMPVDEGPRDASFKAFREKFISAVNRRDAAYILSITDRNIKISFGDENGIANFKRVWKPERRNSDFWKEISLVINNGGVFDKNDRNMFYAPYLFSKFPSDLDEFEHFAIFGNNVNLRSAPDLNSEIVARLSYNIVKIDQAGSVLSPGENGKPIWYKIETLGGLKGFVKPEFVRSSIDFRAGFEKRAGKWKMIFFLAGD
jgi:hypothetical protein